MKNCRFPKTALLVLASTALLSCNGADSGRTSENPTPSPLPPMEISRVRATSFYIEKESPLCEYHPWKAFDQDLTTTWMQDGDGDGTGQIITIDFQTPLKADMIRIIPYKHLSPDYQYYNRIKTLTLVMDNERIRTTAPPGVIVRETAFAEREISQCKILIDDIYKGTRYNRVRIAEIELVLAGQTIPMAESLDFTMIKSIDLHQGLSRPAGKKLFLSGRGVFYLYPDGQYASGSAVSKTTGYWAFDPYNLMIYVTETIQARVEGTGDSVKLTGPNAAEYFEDYRYREEAIRAGRTIDWLDTIYRGVHLDQPGITVTNLDSGDWVVFASDESSPAVENYMKERERLYEENRNKSTNQ